MEIRSYQRQDLKAMIELFHNTVLKINRKDYGQAQVNVWARTLDTIDERVWHQQFDASNTYVAVIDEKIVGFINIYNNGYMDKLYVHHQYQRQGIASVLCDMAESKVTNPIKVDSSITAYKFFTNRGYQLQAEEQKIINHVVLTRYKLLKPLKA